ncbi:hypothetical protein [Vibrio breoganii]|uniref:hypothetical protein n=1 Tax=Vibrio breoganii TaxID=553239 RepID=UPI000C829AA4|nr:hypothetical protein [Vibrio breoganii]PMK30636.1 hypothetical protein BCU03_09470 [Vibrio breoganii]
MLDDINWGEPSKTKVGFVLRCIHTYRDDKNALQVRDGYQNFYTIEEGARYMDQFVRSMVGRLNMKKIFMQERRRVIGNGSQTIRLKLYPANEPQYKHDYL